MYSLTRLPRRSLRATLCATLLALAGCSASRDIGTGRPITSYNYVVVGEEATQGYQAEAASILGQSFFVLRDNDPRLDQPAVLKDACVVTVDTSRGFWSTSADVEMQDFRTRNTIISSRMRRGMLYMGAHNDALDALREIAAARGPRPAVETATSSSPPPESAVEGESRRTKAERLTELNELRAQGLITESEYARQRRAIIEER